MYISTEFINPIEAGYCFLAAEVMANSEDAKAFFADLSNRLLKQSTETSLVRIKISFESAFN